MKQVNPYKEMIAIGKSGSIADFVAAAVDNRKNPKALEKLKEGMGAAEENFLSWQKAEAIAMLNNGDTPDADNMTVPLRVAFEVAKAQKKYLPPGSDTFRSIKQDLKPSVFAAAEAVVTPLPSGRAPRVKDAVRAVFSHPLNEWLKKNRKLVAEFHKKYPEITIVVDRPVAGGPTEIRVTSPEFEAEEAKRLAKIGVTQFLNDGIQTRQPVAAPEKASFRKRTVA